MDQSHRYFLALELGPAERTKLADFLGEIAPRFASSRPSWVGPELFHLTLYFFGPLFAGFPELLAARLGPRAATIGQPSLSSGRLRYLPDARRPRLLCLDFGLQPQTVFEPLLLEARSLASEVGAQVEDRPWLPHLTLGRLKVPSGAPSLADRPRPPTISLKPSRCVLYASTLGREGPSYEKIVALPFAGHEPGGEASF